MTQLLPDHPWRRRYESPPDDLVEEFYRPAFDRSVTYKRAVGFFSSTILAIIAPEIDGFAARGGSMRLITSPANLSDDDLNALGKGERLRSRLREDLVGAISAAPLPGPVVADRLKLLTWMVATGLLEVRIALREHPHHYTLFHEKIGVFIDEAGNWMTFTGSPNETSGGARTNAESFPLHRSWLTDDQRLYAEEERDRFDGIWDERVAGLASWTVNGWIAQPMRGRFGVREPERDLVIAKPERPDPDPMGDAVSLPVGQPLLLPSIPAGLDLRDYQKRAANAWLESDGRGMFAMATGTGKTVTALTAATQVSKHAARGDRPLLVLVIVPSLDLVEQWRDAANWFGFRPAVCHGGLTRTEERELKRALSAARAPLGRRAEMVVTTASSLAPPTSVEDPSSEHFLQRQLSRHTGLLMVIGDEVHSLGTDTRLRALPDNPTYTLGLSATPKRHGDEEGTQALVDYFGEPVISISIKQAIEDHGALVPYDYHPHFVELTADEAERYAALSARIAAAYGSDNDNAAEVAIRERTRLTQHAANKMPKFRTLLAGGLKDQTHQFVYVAEGKDPESELRALDETERVMREDFGMAVARYYGKTDGDRRQVLQRQLAEGDVQALVAMKCLDEGIDIPSARIGVITASSRNPRQFVQRRGRLLRKDPDNPKPSATIHDLIVLPPPPDGGELSDSEKTLIGAELARAAELAEAARNHWERSKLREAAVQFGLDRDQYRWMDLEGDEQMEEWT